MKQGDTFKKLKTQDLELEQGIVMFVDRKFGWFSVVSENTLFRISLSSAWYMEMLINIPTNNQYINPPGRMV